MSFLFTYEIQKVEVGNHEIEVFNSENTKIAQDSITIESSQNSNVANKTIAWKNNTSSEYLKIDVNASTNAVTNYDIVSQIEVTYNTNGGDTLSPNTKTVSFNNTYGTLPEPTKTGSTFTTWSLEQSGGYPVDEDTVVTTPTNHTLYAQWNLNQYIVNFNANTGSVSPESKTVTYSLEYGDLPTPTKIGHDFLGWFTEANGGTQVSSTDTVSITGSQTLYAHYQIKSYILNLVKGENVTSITATGCTTVTEGLVYTCTYGASVAVSATTSGTYRVKTLSGINIESKQNGVAFNMPVPTSGNSVTLTATALDYALKAVMLRAETAYADNVASPFVTSPTGINFGKKTYNTNGKGLYYTTDSSKTENGERVYYYRGDIKNNNLIFAGFCWKIVRTVEDGSIRIIYNQIPTNGACPNSRFSYPIGGYYNQTTGDNAYAGYMMGIDNQCTGGDPCSTTIHTTSKAQAQTNTYSSDIKKQIDGWYVRNIYPQTNILPLIADTPYCNDRSITDVTNNLGYGTNQTYYASWTRLDNYNNIPTPTYKCAQNNDKFTVSASLGNGALTYPVALITADEIVFASGGDSQNTSFLSTTPAEAWTLTPSAHFSDSSTWILTMGNTGGLGSDNLNVRLKAFPVISLVPTAVVSSGTGSRETPYIIETN